MEIKLCTWNKPWKSREKCGNKNVNPHGINCFLFLPVCYYNVQRCNISKSLKTKLSLPQGTKKLFPLSLIKFFLCQFSLKNLNSTPMKWNATDLNCAKRKKNAFGFSFIEMANSSLSFTISRGLHLKLCIIIISTL